MFHGAVVKRILLAGFLHKLSDQSKVHVTWLSNPSEQP